MIDNRTSFVRGPDYNFLGR